MIKYLVVLLVAAGVIYAVFLRDKPAIDARTATDIATVLKKPNAYDGRPVTVRGTVLASAAILGVGGYRLGQGDAEVLVLGRHGIPEIGTQVTVSGMFKQAVALNDMQYAVILEK